MPAWILAIDAILDIKAVQYLLLTAVAILLVVSGVSMVRQKALSIQLNMAKNDVAAYSERLLSQNAAIAKAGEEKKAQDARIADASDRATQSAKEAAKWRKRATETVPTGSCEDMVDQVITWVKP